MGLKLSQRISESMQISNPRGHHIYKKPEECIFKDFKIVLHTFDTDQNQKEITRQGPPYGPEIESKSIGKYANLESAWTSYLQEIGRVNFQRFYNCAPHLNLIENMR